MTKLLDIGELQTLYDEAERVDKHLFAEQRSSILLVSGEHYSKRGGKYGNQTRISNKSSSEYQKLRLTKNHTGKIQKRWVTNILKYSSGVVITPQLDTERQDIKSAEMHQAVYDHLKEKDKLKEKFRNFCGDFVTIGECIGVIKWDPNIGDLVGYQQRVSAEGIPEVDGTGNMVPDELKPVFKGGFRHERRYGYNFMRDPGARSYDDCSYVLFREMVSTKYLRTKYAERPDVLKGISDNSAEEYIIFDSTRGGYEKVNGQTMIREYYFRVSPSYPQGYFFITTPTVILEHGPLPLAKWPVVYKAFDEHPSSPRGRGLVKQIRPYQAEINRAASSQALHQITLGDDKLIYQSGTRLAPGGMLPGVRGISYQGAKPDILPGRDGAQYDPYIRGQIDELYNVTDTMDISMPNSENKGGGDVYALLFRSAAQRQAMSIHSEKFAEFQVEYVTLLLDFAKAYLPDDEVIQMVGKREIVNMAEYKRSGALGHQILVKPQDDTLETQYGKQLTLQHLLQYSGQSLEREDVGMIAKNMPLGNSAEIFDDMTMDYENSKNLLLALDRGEFPEIDQEENHKYIIKKITNRMRQSDFRYLDPQIQQAYAYKRQEHNQMRVQQEQQILAMQSEYIPVDGAMIGCDMYVENPKDPTKTKRARIPQSSLNWLLKMMESQSGSLEDLEKQKQGASAEMSQQYHGSGPGRSGASGLKQPIGRDNRGPQTGPDSPMGRI